MRPLDLQTLLKVEMQFTSLRNSHVNKYTISIKMKMHLKNIILNEAINCTYHEGKIMVENSRCTCTVTHKNTHPHYLSRDMDWPPSHGYPNAPVEEVW